MRMRVDLISLSESVMMCIACGDKSPALMQEGRRRGVAPHVNTWRAHACARGRGTEREESFGERGVREDAVTPADR